MIDDFFGKINRLFGPQANVYTKTIRSCNPGSIAWFHEERHLWQYDNFPNFLDFFGLFLQFSLCVMLGIFIAGARNLWLPLIMWPSFIILMIIEIDANIYSLVKWWKNR